MIKKSEREQVLLYCLKHVFFKRIIIFAAVFQKHYVFFEIRLLNKTIIKHLYL